MGCDATPDVGSPIDRNEPKADDDPGPLAPDAETRANAALTASLRTVFDALGEGFCVIEMIYDDDGTSIDYRYIEINSAFMIHSGLGDVTGRTALETVPSVEASWIEAYGEVARGGVPILLTREAAALRRWFDVYAWPLGPIGTNRVALHFTDATERLRIEDERRYRSEQFHALVEQAPIGVYLVDADGRILEVNPAARPVFGELVDLVGRDYGDALRTIVLDDVADEVVRIARHTLLTGVPHHEPEMRVVRAGLGTTEYYDWSVDRIRLPDGSNGIVCYFSDITSHVLARHALAASEHRYRTLFESIDEGFCIVEVVFDDDRPVDYRFLDVNPAFVRHTGIEDAVGRSITELVPDIEPSWIEAFGRVASTGEPTRFVEHARSMGRWFDDYVFRVGEPHERKVAVLFTDITERKRAEHALRNSVSLLRYNAHHDTLTGLPNRLLFEDRLSVAVSDAQRTGRSFALLFLDLDEFKSINDAHGHAGGDAVLVEVARRLRRALRASDTLARIHGDEFVVILPDASELDEIRVLEQKVRAAVNNPIEIADTTVRVNVSIGVSRYPTDGTNAQDLLRAADGEMYRAKRAGRFVVGDASTMFAADPEDLGEPA